MMEFRPTEVQAYVETSVWSMMQPGQDAALQKATEEFLARLEHGRFTPCISALVITELRQAPAAVGRALFEALERAAPVLLDVSEDAERLADLYVESGVVSKLRRNDALHVAIATVEEMNILVSWNYRHLANVRRAERFNAVNSLQGFYRPLAIHTPLEVLDAEDA